MALQLASLVTCQPAKCDYYKPVGGGSVQCHQHNNNSNSVALVCERNMATERPPSFGEVSANLCG
jgi:hypothetical protein